MTPGERVTVITKIASALDGRRWTDIDLVLDEFGLPTSDWPSADTYAYVVEQVRRSDDALLLAVHDHLFPGEAILAGGRDSRHDEAGGVWDPGAFRLFISHSSKQASEVGELKTELAWHAIGGFVAHDDIEPTQEWLDVIEVALHTCEAMAVYLTPDFHPSKWTDQEVGVALARAILVIPIRKGETPYGFLGKYQALQGANKLAPRLAEDVAEILRTHALHCLGPDRGNAVPAGAQASADRRRRSSALRPRGPCQAALPPTVPAGSAPGTGGERPSHVCDRPARASARSRPRGQGGSP